jgi:hypothetical protein
MKIIITENQYKKLLEQQLDIFDDVDICQTGIDYENFNPWMKMVFINLPNKTPQEREDMYNQIKDLECDIKLNNIITGEVFTVSPKDIRLTKTNFKMLYIWNDVYDNKIFPNLTNIEQFESFVDSTPIKKALEIAFKSNWRIENNTHVAGVVGVLPIKTDPNGWSIVNFFNTKKSVKDKIKLFLVRDYKNGTFDPNLDDIKGSVIDWMANLFSNINSSDMKELVKIQEKSINTAYSKEILDAEMIKDKLHPDGEIEISGFGTKKDIIQGIDATIGGVTYQIKPCDSYNDKGDIVYVSIGHSNANDYTKNPVDRIAFFKGKDMYIFNNKSIYHKGNTYGFKKSDMIYPKTI